MNIQFFDSKTLADAHSEELGTDETKKDYFSVVATITQISHNKDRPPWYKSAPDGDKYSKVVDGGHGKWHCAKTNKDYDSYVPR